MTYFRFLTEKKNLKVTRLTGLFLTVQGFTRSSEHFFRKKQQLRNVASQKRVVILNLKICFQNLTKIRMFFFLGGGGEYLDGAAVLRSR